MGNITITTAMMKLLLLGAILISVTVLVLAEENNDLDHRSVVENFLGKRNSDINESKRGWCNPLGSHCKFKRCCGSYHCWRTDGLDGKCVICIPPAGKCQRDKQCCTKACNKEKRYHINGKCGIRLN